MHWRRSARKGSPWRGSLRKGCILRGSPLSRRRSSRGLRLVLADEFVCGAEPVELGQVFGVGHHFPLSHSPRTRRTVAFDRNQGTRGSNARCSAATLGFRSVQGRFGQNSMRRARTSLRGSVQPPMIERETERHDRANDHLAHCAPRAGRSPPGGDDRRLRLVDDRRADEPAPATVGVRDGERAPVTSSGNRRPCPFSTRRNLADTLAATSGRRCARRHGSGASSLAPGLTRRRCDVIPDRTRRQPGWR